MPGVEPSGPIDPAQLRLAERRLLEAMRRFHRREPLRRDLRVDRLIAELHAAAPSVPQGHRGGQRLTLSSAELRSVIDGLVASGALVRQGHRVRAPGELAGLEPVMRERLDELMRTLSQSGALPPPAERLAARLGIPSALLDELRAAGELVTVGAGMDYPRRTWSEIRERLDRMAAEDPLSVRSVRDELHTTRRHAEAILRHRRFEPRRSEFVP